MNLWGWYEHRRVAAHITFTGWKKKQKSFTSPVTKKKSFENHNLDTEKLTSFQKEMNAEFIDVNSKSFS